MQRGLQSTNTRMSIFQQENEEEEKKRRKKANNKKKRKEEKKAKEERGRKAHAPREGVPPLKTSAVHKQKQVSSVINSVLGRSCYVITTRLAA